MAKLIEQPYGKALVRVLKILRDGPVHTIREIEVWGLLAGDLHGGSCEVDVGIRDPGHLEIDGFGLRRLSEMWTYDLCDLFPCDVVFYERASQLSRVGRRDSCGDAGFCRELQPLGANDLVPDGRGGAAGLRGDRAHRPRHA